MRTNVTLPIVVDLGKARRAEVEQLRKGAGPLVDDVEDVMRLVRSNLDTAGEKRILFPVVVVYTKG